MVYTISTRELQTVLQARENVKLVDVVPEEDFLREHIHRAISLPVGEIEGKASRVLEKNDLIVVYGRDSHPSESEAAVQALLSLGFKHIVSYGDGFDGYKRARLPVETWI